ncbi:hypothetical protein Y1Q_0005323 [Alligator mississippiensis]|uniref:Uncharacterized protein n=1 Tax=Alligator mississippiensis TaxID=8496 RepID=A0A151MVK5_ALLMI|nr:hypothetical protein Y1Q_0005323 [Alligator mississippiensis]
MVSLHSGLCLPAYFISKISRKTTSACIWLDLGFGSWTNSIIFTGEKKAGLLLIHLLSVTSEIHACLNAPPTLCSQTCKTPLAASYVFLENL